MRKYKIVALICLVFLCLFAFFEYSGFYDGKLHVVVCEVGQGDGVIVKTPQNKVLVYDGGPDEKMLACLSDYLPFWHKTIDVMILSHPHNDHFIGMFSILPVYTTKSYISEAIMNRSQSFAELQKELTNRGIPQHILGRGDRVGFSDGVELKVLGPSKEFEMRTSPDGVIGNSGEFASLVVSVSYQDFSLLLTGDSQVSGLMDASPKAVTVLQVPHHGSRTGLNEEILDRINPRFAFISVGKNSYGHPTEEILSLLQRQNIRTARTDRNGRIVYKSDGKRVEVITER